MGRARDVGVWTQRLAIGAVVVLVVGLAVRVGSTSREALSFRDPLVWLASTATGEVVQADAGSGEVTARVKVGNGNDSLAVIQHGHDALVLNRVHPETSEAPDASALSSLLASRGLAVDALHIAQAQADEAARARTEAPELAKARKLFAPERLWLVPVMAGDVRGLADLAKVSRALVG